jgi:hypothetical protein
VGNDITQSHPDFKTIVWLGSTREVLRKPYLVGLSLEYSYVYRMLRATTRIFRERFSKRAEGATFSKAVYLSIEHQRSTIFEARKSTFIQESYRGAIQLLRQMAVQASRAGMDFLCCARPDEIQVNTKLRSEVINRYSMEGKNMI